jgi:hypothetical protein
METDGSYSLIGSDCSVRATVRRENAEGQADFQA